MGRYHILEQLGEGGMATVYKAYDTRLECDVAVKIIRTEKLTIETMGKTLKRFERKAKALAKLTHPNIVPIMDYGEHDEKPYLVMPYLPGGTLKQQLESKPMLREDAVRLLIPIACALHYAHQQGIIHRDVKPSNILITQSGKPMLTDFGIAEILLDNEETADLTGTGMGVGTPEYMSPEQFQGKGVDARTDVYSLGVVLYEMITGRKPYQADTPAAVLIKQVTEPLPRSRSFVSELPEDVEKILLKAMAKEKENRYREAGAFGAGLPGTVPPAWPSTDAHTHTRPGRDALPAPGRGHCAGKR
ncbi:MAG: serine/threonine-protein kinase, partial [Candidatus Villigracilaceae bacterium]